MDDNDEGEPGMTNEAIIANIREYFPPADIEGAIRFIETISGLPPPPPPPPVPRVESFREAFKRQHYANLQEEIDNEANGNADRRPPPRTEILNSDTPVTFKLDWNYCEKARVISANPVAQEGVTTLMGPPSARFDEEFDNSDDDDDDNDDSEEQLDPASIIIISVAKLLRRSQNYEVQIIPDEYIKSEMQEKEEDSEKEGRIRNDTNKRIKTEHTRTKLTKKEETNILEQREFEFLKTNDDVPVIVRDAETKEVVAMYTTTGSTNNTPWIVIRCENDGTTSNMMKLFNGGEAKNYYDTNDNDQYFILRTVPHQEKYLSWKEVLPLQSIEEKKILDTESYRLEMVTGISPSIFSKRGDTNNTTSWLHPTTMFKLYFINSISITSSNSSATRTDKDEKNEDDDGVVGGDEIHKILVGQCLCSYKLASTDECGPTIEMIEMADAWQRHGLGSVLLKAMYTYFNKTFVIAAMSVDEMKDTYFFVHDTDSDASRWFQQRHGFRDDDGMGDLRKVFLPEDCKDEN